MNKYLEALQDAAARPVWHDPDIMPEPLAPLTSDEKCELLIVGGGFTGLWAAMQAKERKPDVDIILIEQTFIGDGASGRNGGFLSSTLAHTQTKRPSINELSRGPFYNVHQHQYWIAFSSQYSCNPSTPNSLPFPDSL